MLARVQTPRIPTEGLKLAPSYPNHSYQEVVQTPRIPTEGLKLFAPERLPRGPLTKFKRPESRLRD